MGLWCAWELKQRQPNYKVTILERSLIPSGASTRNAGFACFGSPSELLHDRQLLGEEKMWQVVDMRFRGMQKIARIFSHSDIQLEICGGYEVYNTSTEVNDEALSWLNNGLKNITGINECFTRYNHHLSSFGFKGFTGMIRNQYEGYLHSGKLVQRLLQMVQAAGVQIFTSVTVEKWEQVNGMYIVDGPAPIQFRGRQLLFCTNAFTSLLLPSVNIAPARGQLLLTVPIDSLSFKGAFHYDQGYYYFRNLGNRILLGGARNAAFDEEHTHSMVTSTTIQQQLEQFLHTHLLPGKDVAIAQRWSGIMGFTDNKEPVLQTVGNNMLAAVSCNGMGVALAPIMAEKVCEILL